MKDVKNAFLLYEKVVTKGYEVNSRQDKTKIINLLMFAFANENVTSIMPNAHSAASLKLRNFAYHTLYINKHDVHLFLSRIAFVHACIKGDKKIGRNDKLSINEFVILHHFTQLVPQLTQLNNLDLLGKNLLLNDLYKISKIAYDLEKILWLKIKIRSYRMFGEQKDLNAFESTSKFFAVLRTMVDFQFEKPTPTVTAPKSLMET